MFHIFENGSFIFSCRKRLSVDCITLEC